MPRPSKGTRTPGSGRKPGTPNKSTYKVEEILQRKNCNPFEVMADIMLGNVECNVCRGVGRSRYKLKDEKFPCQCINPDDAQGVEPEQLTHLADKNCPFCSATGIQTIGVRTCQSCYGTLYEAISPELRGKMGAELAQYQAPKRKAVEHSGTDGGPIDHRMEVVFVSPKK